MYEGYPESKFRWAIKKKKKNISQTMYIAVGCTYHTLHFDIISIIVEAPVMALHQFLYPFNVEWCRLQCTARGNGFFDLTVVEEPLAKQEGFKMQEQIKITWC